MPPILKKQIYILQKFDRHVERADLWGTKSNILVTKLRDSRESLEVRLGNHAMDWLPSQGGKNKMKNC